MVFFERLAGFFLTIIWAFFVCKPNADNDLQSFESINSQMVLKVFGPEVKFTEMGLWVMCFRFAWFPCWIHVWFQRESNGLFKRYILVSHLEFGKQAAYKLNILTHSKVITAISFVDRRQTQSLSIIENHRHSFCLFCGSFFLLFI